jgi:hypothetical protein
MNYYDAARIRKKGFANLMTDRLASGQGIVSSLRGTMSDRSMAKSMAMKERFDPMNIAKFLTGGSKLAPAIVGRLMGRSKQDIRYFTGKKQYETGSHRPNYYEKFNSGMGGGRSGKATEILEKIVSFMQDSREKDLEEQDTFDSYNEMNEYMKEDNHKEVMNVFRDAIKKQRKAMKDMAKEAKKRQVQEKAETTPSTPSTPTQTAPKPPAQTSPPAQTAPKPVTQAKDAADAAKKAKDAKDAADAAKKAKDAKDAADAASAAKKAKDAADAASAAKKAKDAADAASAAKKAKDAADAASAAKKAKDAADAAKKAKDAADAKRIKDAADAKKAADTAKKQEPIPTTQPSASKVITGAAAVTAVLAGKEALATNIAKYESTASAGKSFAGNEYNAYNRGTKDNKILGAIAPVDFSKITISEYLRRSELPIDDPDRLFAVGRYQIIPKTMRGLIEQLKIDPNTTYLTPTVQDHLFSKGLIDINRKKVSNYIEGKTNGIDARNEAILQLSKEFASVGVPFDTYRIDKIKQKDGSIKEVRVELKKGSSYYSGIGGNKAHNSPEEVGVALDADRASKAKLQTNDTTVGSSLNDSSMKNANMKKDMSQGSASGSPVIIQNNTTNKQKTIQSPSAPLGELNPRIGN